MIILGNSIVIQAWALRRMVSVFNCVTRRPHVPREVALRRLLRSQGFDIPLEMPMRGPRANGESNDEGDDISDTEQDEDETSESASCGEEGSESTSCADVDEFPPVTEADPNPLAEEPNSFCSQSW